MDHDILHELAEDFQSQGRQGRAIIGPAGEITWWFTEEELENPACEQETLEVLDLREESVR